MHIARSEVSDTISKLADSEPDIPEWVLTSFNDPDAELVTKTDNPEDLKSGLNGLEYGGGGDVPEQAFRGTMYYMLGSKWTFQKCK